MYPKFFLSTLAVLSLSISECQSSLRIDLDDRTPQEVYDKAKSMAQTYPGTAAVGALVINNMEIATAIALDPYTLLTAAHMGHVAGEVHTLSFKLGSYVLKDLPGEPAYMKLRSTVSTPIYHPEFVRLPCGLDLPFSTDTKGEAYCAGIPLEETQNYTMDQFQRSIFSKNQNFQGVDLAIVKLTSPLPASLDYPEFLSPAVPVSNMLGASLGYGPMRTNTQDKPPHFFTCNEVEGRVKHLISVHVHAYQQPAPLGVHLLHGSYKGLLINGDESFIPTPDMMKTEGLPVAGDSGGPLFIKVNDKPFLAGIMSTTYSLTGDPFDKLSSRQMFGTAIQPIFPAWIDVRYYQDWIKSHMGPTQKK